MHAVMMKEFAAKMSSLVDLLSATIYHSLEGNFMTLHPPP